MRQMSRRDHLRMLGTGATALAGSSVLPLGNTGAEPGGMGQFSVEEFVDRERRMKWWHEARFGCSSTGAFTP